MCQADEVSGQVVGVAIVGAGRLLAARRTHPLDTAGWWELPGGKAEEGESIEDAAVREVAEELSCHIEVTGSMSGEVPVGAGRTLVVRLARVIRGEPIPVEHDAIRWLGPDQIGEVAWLDADHPFLDRIRQVLLDRDSPAALHSGVVRL